MQAGAPTKISDFLSPDHVMIDIHAGDKRRLLEQLSTQAADDVGLAAQEVATEVAKREELGSTGVGSASKERHPSAFSLASATASSSMPSMASPWTSSFFCCFPTQPMAPPATHWPASPAR